MADDSTDGEPTPGAPIDATAPPAQVSLDDLTREPALNDALSPPHGFMLEAGDAPLPLTLTEQPRTEAIALTPVVATTDELSVYVFGANVGAAPDAATAKLAKRVLQISVVLILLQAIIAVVYYVRDEPLALILITLCFSLAHPTCGIFGVMNKDRSLLCMFCGYGCNGIGWCCNRDWWNCCGWSFSNTRKNSQGRGVMGRQSRQII